MPPEPKQGQDQQSPASLSDDLSSRAGGQEGQPVGEGAAQQPQPLAEGGGQPSPGPKDDGASGDASLRKFYKDTFGVDLTSKYESDFEAAKGLANAYKLVGERNEDAELGRRLRTEPGTVLQELLSQYGGPPQQEPQKPATGEEPIYDPKWLEYIEVKVDDDGNQRLVPVPGAPPGILEKIDRGREQLQQVIVGLANNPVLRSLATDPQRGAAELARLIVPHVDRWTQTTMAQQEEQATISQFRERHAKWLYEDGKLEGKLTERGQRLADLADQIVERVASRGGFIPLSEALERAYDAMAREAYEQMQRSGGSPPPVPRGAGRAKPNLASPPKGAEVEISDNMEADLLRVMQSLSEE